MNLLHAHEIRYRIITDPCEAIKLEAMTYPAYRSLLEQAGRSSLVVLEAQCSEPIGLALAELDDQGEATLLSLFVHKTARSCGIGRELLSRMVAELEGRGATSVHATFADTNSSAEYFSSLLMSSGWSHPVASMLLIQGQKHDVDRILASRWMRPRQLPVGWSLVSWGDLSPSQLDAIFARHTAQPWFPEYVSPRNDAEILDPHFSVGLVIDGDVRGWMILHRIKPDVLRYTALFVDPAIQHHGASIWLMAESLRRQTLTPDAPQYATAGFYENHGVGHFILRRFGNDLLFDRVTCTYRSKKRRLTQPINYTLGKANVTPSATRSG